MSFRRYPSPSSASNPSVATNGGASPTSSTLVAGQGPGSIQTPVQVNSAKGLSTSITDPVTGAQAAVTAFHNSDNQTFGGTTYGLFTGGVAQVINPTGGLDRQRETGLDNISALGVATGTQQLASPFATNSSTAITASASVQAVTPALMSGLSAGSGWKIQTGTVLLIDVSAAQETVTVISATATTFSAVFTKSHTGTYVVAGFAYNQARDASIPDGSLGTGLSASATLLYNAILNSGAGGWERERSASGELDNANGTGTAVAAEYEFNGLTFDRARSLQGKMFTSVAITSGGTTGSSSLVLPSVPAGLTAGSQVRLFNGTSYEGNWVTSGYVSGTTVTLQNAIVSGTHTSFQWEAYSVNGPGINGFLPVGVGIEEEALWDPVSQLYYVERAATQDAMPPQNIVAESPALWNGTNFDRTPGDKTNGMFVNIKAGSVSVSNFPATQVVSGTVAVSTLPALPAGANAIGSVSVSNFPASQTITGSVSVSNFPATQAISAASLPLPSGAATDSTLTALSAKLNSLGQKTSVASAPVVLASDQSAIPVSGSVSVSNFPGTQVVSGTVAVSALPALPAGANAIGSVSISNLPSLYTDNITQIGGAAISLGQKTAAASFPVTPASDYIPPSPKGRTSNFIYRNVYSGNSVLTSGYLQVAAVTSSNINEIEIFDSSGQTMALAVGSAGIEVNQVYIFPGGNGRMPLFIASGSRISLIAISASATVGEININFYS